MSDGSGAGSIVRNLCQSVAVGLNAAYAFVDGVIQASPGDNLSVTCKIGLP